MIPEKLIWSEKYYAWLFPVIGVEAPSVSYKILAELSMASSSDHHLCLLNRVPWFINKDLPFPVTGMDVYLTSIKIDGRHIVMALEPLGFAPYRKYNVGLLGYENMAVDVIGKFVQMGWQLSAKTWIAMAQEDLGWQASKPLDYTRASMINVLPAFINCVSYFRDLYAKSTPNPDVVWFLARGHDLAADIGFEWSGRKKRYILHE